MTLLDGWLSVAKMPKALGSRLWNLAEQESDAQNSGPPPGCTARVEARAGVEFELHVYTCICSVDSVYISIPRYTYICICKYV